MAAINFPNPNNQTPLNQYGPESVAASLNGVTYSWSNDNIWYAQTTVANFGDIYVERTGSNMTGNLTFNTDKLTLTALDGSASFKGVVDINVVVDTVNKEVFTATGSTTDGSEGGTLTYRNDGACYWRNKDEVDNIVFAADGSATFAGKIESNFATGNMFEADAVWGSNNCAYRSRYGGVGDRGRYHFFGTSTDGKNVSIYTDGSASFAGGDCNIKDNGRVSTNQYFESYRTEAGSAILTGGIGTWDSQTAVNVNIKADGSASFAGSVDSIRFDATNTLYNPVFKGITGGKNTSYLCANGQLFLGQDITSGADGSNIPNGFKIRLNGGNGSASFAGGVEIQGDGEVGTYIGQGRGEAASPGLFITKRNVGVNEDVAIIEGSSGSFVIQGDGEVNINKDAVVIQSDGSATFSGNVNCTSDSTNTASLVSAGYVLSNRTSGASSVFDGQLNGVSTSGITAAGSASFAGTVDMGTPNSATTPGARVSYVGQLVSNCETTGEKALIIKALNQEKALINSDGSASFAQSVTLGSAAVPADNGFTALIDNPVASTAASFSANNLNANGYNYVGANGLGSANITFFVMNNGDATFAGNVTANGTILTLASGNLDVGDRLKKADDALKALKTAAAAAADFAALKAAIATALTNI